MRYLSFMVVLWLSVTTVAGQGFSFSAPVKVVDNGGMYTSFKWNKKAEAELNGALGADMASAVMKSSNESTWPKGIASLDNRTKNKDKFGDYTAFYMTTINETMAVLFVPAVENSSLAEDMRPTQDIYFLIDEKGIAAQAVQIGNPVGDFAKELNVITNDFRNSFVNLMSDEVQEANDQTAKLTGCKVDLDDAYQLFFYEDLNSHLTSFRAAFAGDADYGLTLLVYQNLIRKVDGLSLDCGPLQKNGETVNERLHSQTYNIMDNDFSYDEIYEKMVLEVTIEPVETFDDYGDLVTEWEAVLYIYEN